MVYSIILVDPSKAESLEPLGTKRKYWFRDAENRRWLFKAEERKTGEDWAEKIACELAKRIGLPHVNYELAEEIGTGTPGVVCETFTPPPLALVLGNELLLKIDPDYPAGGRRYKVGRHTVDAVAEVLRKLEPPLREHGGNMPSGVSSALDVFVGYVMFDAWIANQDRHHENWGAVRSAEKLYLAPTFDHGAALARNLRDQERAERLSTRDVNRSIPAFVRRARSAFYQTRDDRKPLSTVDAWLAFAAMVPAASKAWLSRLQMIDEETIRQVVTPVPEKRMSSTCCEFTVQLLVENRKRLLAGDRR